MSAPGKLVRYSRWKTGPSKGQRPLGSECCVAAGDSGDEAYTAIAWDVGLSLERSISREPRVFIRARRQHVAAPSCEVLTPCRGLRPHHVQKDRIGTWERTSLPLQDLICRSKGVRRGPPVGLIRAQSMTALGINLSVTCYPKNRTASGKQSYVIDASDPPNASRSGQAASGLIQSGDSQIVRSSSSSHDESGNYGQGHAGRSPSA